MKKLKKPLFARLSPLAKGRIVGLREACAERGDIVTQVKKSDGKPPCLKTVDTVLQRFKADPEWDGLEERTAGGRPRNSRAEHRGHIEVTSRSCK